MQHSFQFHRNESGQAALENAIILIAFIVVASVFAFTILSAGSSSTERGEEAIYSGLEGVQSSMAVKGAIIAEQDGTNDAVGTIKFTVAKASGGEPVNLDSDAPVVVIAYRDDAQFKNSVPWTSAFIVDNDADTLLEDGELAEITVTLTGTDGLTTPLGINTAFTLEVKPPTGAILTMNRSTPASIEAVMELR